MFKRKYYTDGPAVVDSTTELLISYHVERDLAQELQVDLKLVYGNRQRVYLGTSDAEFLKMHSGKLADNAVTKGKFANNAVTDSKIS
jgi:hypothetical protein